MMSNIRFYEKPGCINNTKQKKLLSQAGYEVEARNLLTEPWSRERLEAFFDHMAVVERFNRSAPMIVSGQVVPEELDNEQAYQLMLEEPLLIRRPLIEIGGHRLVGFEQEKINRVLAISLVKSESGSLEACPRTAGNQCDEAGE